MGQERLGSLCRISLHKGVLKKVEDENMLLDKIVQKFMEKPRRLNFHFKWLHILKEYPQNLPQDSKYLLILIPNHFNMVFECLVFKV